MAFEAAEVSSDLALSKILHSLRPYILKLFSRSISVTSARPGEMKRIKVQYQVHIVEILVLQRPP